jgi:hypothetical protein
MKQPKDARPDPTRRLHEAVKADENLPLDQYHGAVLAHLTGRDVGVFDAAGWRELGNILDAWGEASKETTRQIKAFEEDARGF